MLASLFWQSGLLLCRHATRILFPSPPMVAFSQKRGAALLIDRVEKAEVATIDLRAGRKAKASAAYASASAYFSTGMALLDERDWDSQYELTFSLWLERAECELLSGDFEKAEHLIGELLQRGASKVDQAAVYHLKVQFHVTVRVIVSPSLPATWSRSRGFIANQAKVYHAMGIVAFWTQPIATAIDFMRATFRTAIETGDLTFACYGMDRSLTSLLLRNDPLDAVWRESEQALDVCRKARFRDLRDMILNQQRFIATHAGPVSDLLHLQRSFTT
jgi:hypothetical protein